jgi:hypothetical protein
MQYRISSSIACHIIEEYLESKGITYKTKTHENSLSVAFISNKCKITIYELCGPSIMCTVISDENTILNDIKLLLKTEEEKPKPTLVDRIIIDLHNLPAVKKVETKNFIIDYHSDDEDLYT